VYSGHYPGIFVAPKNPQNAETKHWSRAVPILLLALSALTISAYTSLNFLQELNPQPQLLKALVYHSATSAVFTMYGEELERVEVFKYLGHVLAYKDNDSQAVRGNLKKARGIWARISCTLRAENASPHVWYSTKLLCSQSYYLEVRHGSCPQ
jgi:hypothetical protein